MTNEKKTEKRYSVVGEQILLKKYSAIQSYFEEEILEEDLKEQKDIAAMDPANVMMVIALSEKARRFLFRFAKKDAKIPKLAYEKNGSSKYSSNYLSLAIDFLKVSSEESIRISCQADYPITLENDHFKIIIAPRVDD